jgi:MFS transporter, DHA1 family, multidrug resistance protein
VRIKSISPKKKNLYAILVNIIIPLAGISTDIYLPSLPAISDHFKTNNAMTQLTVTFFILAFGFSQFIAGPVADAFGRKKLLLSAAVVQFDILFQNSL